MYTLWMVKSDWLSNLPRYGGKLYFTMIGREEPRNRTRLVKTWTLYKRYRINCILLPPPQDNNIHISYYLLNRQIQVTTNIQYIQWTYKETMNDWYEIASYRFSLKAIRIRQRFGMARFIKDSKDKHQQVLSEADFEPG